MTGDPASPASRSTGFRGSARAEGESRRRIARIDLAFTLAFQCEALKLPKPVRELRFAPPRRWRFDLAWPDHWVAAEVDGATYAQGRHARGQGIHADCEKVSTAAAMGWRVLRFDREMVEDGSAVALVERALQCLDGGLEGNVDD